MIWSIDDGRVPHPHNLHIVVHYVAQRGTTPVNTSVLDMLAQGIAACDSPSCARMLESLEISNILLHRADQLAESCNCKYQWFGHARTRNERL